MNRYRKYASLLVATAALLASSVCFSSCTAQNGDPWDYSVGIPISELDLDDPAKKLFTGKEWTGKTISKDVDGNLVSQSDIVRVNTLEHHTVGTVVYDSVESAVDGAINYNRMSSNYYMLLTGDGNLWDLAVYKNESDADEAGVLNEFYKTDYNMSAAPKYSGEDRIYSYSNAYYGGFKRVELPASWQTQGFDFPIYTNYTYPWNDGAYGNAKVMAPTAPSVTNPVGFYRYEFDIDESWITQNRRVYISFGGVESAYYVYLNGYEVGYSEDSFDPAEFDLTPYLNRDGKKNILAVKVYRWCDGSYFENQDFLRLAGIFRDVYVYSTAGVRISDYTVVTDLDSSYKDASLEISVELSNTTLKDASGLGVDIKLFDADGKQLFESDVMRKSVSKLSAGEKTDLKLKKSVDSPHLWSDEDPYLYTLVLSLYDNSGAYYGSISQQLGFREISFTPTVGTEQNDDYQTVLLNGKPVLLKGIDRHENDPQTGRYVSQELTEKDVRILKSLNINAVRTSHYPNDEKFYNMCDKYGILVMGECNIETHYNVGYDETENYFSKLVRDRIEAHTTAYKNRTCIIMWSMGNETIGGSPSFTESIAQLKQRDPTRPIHFESQDAGGGVDVSSRMYSSIDDVKSRGTWENHMPFLLCEYAHAMGNSVGNLYEYWEPIRANDNIIGAFIWDFVDQALWTEIPEGKNDYYGNGKFLAYGGCWGDNPNSGDFCQNGIIGSDRSIQPEALEVKYVYQSVWFTAADKLSAGNKKLDIYNEFRFTDLSEFDFRYELLCNGKLADSGSFDVSCKPLETVSVEIPFKLPETSEPNSEYLLTVYVCLREDTEWAEAGFEIALEQFEVEFDSASTGIDAESLPKLSVVEDDEQIIVSSDVFELVLSRKDGSIEKYTINGEEVFEKGPVPNYNRARLSNDNMNGELDTARVSSVDKISVSLSDSSTSVTIQERLKLSAKNSYQNVTYTVYGGGQIRVDLSLEPSESVSELLKYGSVITLPKDYENMIYYGRGEADTYNDRKRGSPVGIYTQTVSDSFYPYGNPQDTGNKTGVRYIALTSDKRNTGVLIAADGVLEASALHYSVSDIQNARYVYQLPEVKHTYLNVDFGARGTGGASCGPETLQKYKLLNGQTEFRYSYVIIPFDKSGDDIGYLASVWSEQ